MYIIFDIGGSKTRIARTIDGEIFNEPIRFDTPQQYSEALTTFTARCKELIGDETLEGMFGGIASILDSSRLTPVRVPHLPDWQGRPFVQDLVDAFNVPVHIENDSAAVALGEAYHGAGKGYASMVYLTVSTGVGGARVVNGTLDQGVYNFEPGHQIIANGATLEELVSGSGVEARFGKKPILVDDPTVWEELALCLSYGVYNTILHWSPEIVVLGGSMMVGKPAIPIDRVRDHINRHTKVYPTLPELKLATLKDIGGLYGACALIKMKRNSL